MLGLCVASNAANAGCHEYSRSERTRARATCAISPVERERVNRARLGARFCCACSKAASFREIYGNEVADWRIRAHSQPPQFGLVGAAIDERLAAQLGEVLNRHNYSDWTLNPLATLAAQRKPNQIADWWVLAEPGWLCLFNAVGGYWRYVSGRPVDDHWQSHLPEMLVRETRMAGNQVGKSQTAFIQSVGAGHGTPPVAAGWSWRATQSSLEHGVLALAMG